MDMVSLRSLRVVALLTAILLVVTVAVYPARTVGAAANAPRWTPGDYWDYRDQDGNGIRLEVVASTTVGLPGGAYSAFQVRQTITTGSISITSSMWVRDADLGLVRVEIDIPFIGLTVTTYDPPQAQASFPLFPGKAWAGQTTVRVNISGTQVSTQLLSYNASVVSEFDLSVPAGTFHVAAIWQPSGFGHTMRYYSDGAGYMAKEEDYNGANQKTGERILVSHRYQWSTTITLILVGVGVLIALLVVGFLWKKRKQAMGMPGGPMPPAYGPPQGPPAMSQTPPQRPPGPP